MRPFKSSEEAYKAGVAAGKQLIGSAFDGPSGKLPTIVLDSCDEETPALSFEPVEWEEPKFNRNKLALKQGGCAVQARLMLLGNRHNRSIIVPSYQEWLGIGILEADGELEGLLPNVKVKG